MMQTCHLRRTLHGSQQTQRGLTLPELLVSLSIVSTLTVSAVSHLNTLIQQNRMTTEVNHFVAALQLARSEAVKHGRRVVLCPSRDATNCSTAPDWSRGWLLFASDDRERDPDKPLLHAGMPLAAGIDMRSGNRRKRIVYQPDGSSGGSNSAFTFCDTRRQASPRVICLSNTGRPRLAHTRCDGAAISCP